MATAAASQPPAWKVAANALSAKHGTDVLLVNGHIISSTADRIQEIVSQRNKKKNVSLLVVTPGGDAAAAYRIARCLQNEYPDSFSVILPGYCKSAGTLCVLGANELVMAHCAELGPLDVQLYKKDELGELNSGLVLKEALLTLQGQAFAMYERYMLEIEEKSQGLITFKTATEIATKMAIGLYAPIFGQIDPMQVGEVARSMGIARSYGERLQEKSQNFTADALDTLVESYPDHGFVIDRREAADIFINVREPNAEEASLLKALGKAVRYPAKQTYTDYLSDEGAKDVKAKQRSSGSAASSPRVQNDERNTGGAASQARGVPTPPPPEDRDKLRVISPAK